MDRGVLGRTAVDAITGYEGVIIGVVNYLTGSDRVLMLSKNGSAKPEDGFWFDEDRIKLTEYEAIVLPKLPDG